MYNKNEVIEMETISCDGHERNDSAPWQHTNYWSKKAY